MVRIFAVSFLFLSICPSFLFAEPDTDPRISRALAIQKAMSLAKGLLQTKNAAKAVSVLEAEIIHVNGNESYLALMKEAYLAYLIELKRTNGSADRVEHVRRQLGILDPKLNLDELTASVGAPAAADLPAKPPVPALPALPDIAPLVQAPVDDDPFQQPPLDRQPATDVKAKARAAFEQKHYAQAAALFQQAQQAKQALSAQEMHAWGYCRLSEVVTRLNRGDDKGVPLADLQKEAEAAVQMGGPTLAKFGEQVLEAIRTRRAGGDTETTAVPEGWQAVETKNFRVLVQKSKERATEAAQAAERIRAASFEKWSGPAADWSPRCDIWLHASGADYAKSTGKPAASSGHASVGVKNGMAQTRRIDFHLDDAALLEATLPREVAYVVVSDLFPEQPLPRWADVGMTILAEPTTEVKRYSQAIPRLAQEKKLFSVRDFLKMAEFPEADKITPFYVESVSLVDYLVRLKGARAFVLYLREAPRRGYEEALQRHYGIKDAAELQEQWIKFAMKGE